MFEYVGSKKGKQNGFVPTNNDYDIGKARIFGTKRMLCDLLFLCFEWLARPSQIIFLQASGVFQLVSLHAMTDLTDSLPFGLCVSRKWRLSVLHLCVCEIFGAFSTAFLSLSHCGPLLYVHSYSPLSSIGRECLSTVLGSLYK